MMSDYYEILQVSRDASLQTIKEAYKNKALKCHPDKIPIDAPSHVKLEAEENFKKISEAYQTLSDPIKREQYDQGGKTNFFSDKGSFKEAKYMYEEFLKQYGSGIGMGTTCKYLECTLEELYNGNQYPLQVQRKIWLPDNTFSIEEKIIDVTVPPGCKNDTIFTFPNEGNQYIGRNPEVLQVVVKAKPHKYFQRQYFDSQHLIYTTKITLKQALSGDLLLTIPHLDGTNKEVSLNGKIISPSYVHTLPGLGMPLPENPEIFGDLQLNFKIAFPKSLTTEQQIQVSNLFRDVTWDTVGEESPEPGCTTQ